MKKCEFCQAEYEDSLETCPKCQSGGSGVGAQDSADELQKLAEIINEGVQFFKHGRHAEAEACYRKALELAPDDAAAYCNMGHLMMVEGKNEEAVTWFEKAVQLDRSMDGVPQALEEAKQILRRQNASLSQEEIQTRPAESSAAAPFLPLLKKSRQTLKSLLGSRVCTYERYEAKSEAEALNFLEGRQVTQSFYYVEVQTRGALFGKDVKGIYRLG